MRVVMIIKKCVIVSNVLLLLLPMNIHLCLLFNSLIFKIHPNRKPEHFRFSFNLSHSRKISVVSGNSKLESFNFKIYFKSQSFKFQRIKRNRNFYFRFFVLGYLKNPERVKVFKIIFKNVSFN